MADDKNGREAQAANEERRQRQRELEEARERGEEEEPPAEDLDTPLDDLADGLANHVYPTTAGELREAFGDRDVEVEDGTASVDQLLAPVDDAETYDSVDEARRRIESLRADD